jgi:microcompartment protein CcmL/EutN
VKSPSILWNVEKKGKRMPAAIGIIELSSIAAGFLVQDTMLKAAEVDLLVARTVCPGKYIIIVGGKVASVKASLGSGRQDAEGFLVDELLISNVSEKVFPALSGCVDIPQNHRRAIGIIETFSSASVVEAADAAVKAAQVTLLKIHVAMAIGGKGFMVVCGDVAAVNASLEAGSQRIKSSGNLVNKVVITGASKELFKEYI